MSEPTATKLAEPARSIWLGFDPGRFGDPDHLEDVRRNLSALEFDGTSFWVAGDEGAVIEKLSPAAPGSDRYSEHRRFALAQAFRLPQGDEGEIDIEGVSRDGDRLWIAGSHCRTRRKPPKRPPDSDEDAFEALERMEVRGASKHLNRNLIGCLDLSQEPSETGETFGRKAGAVVPFTAHGNVLTDLLRDDSHLGPFLRLPSKENGFDVEGIAVRGETAFVGLRGPVLGGLAIILELRLRPEGGEIALVPFAGGSSYLKHAVDLGGYGVRDLAFFGDDVLVLAAPTMAVDGTAVVHRWNVARRSKLGGIAKDGEMRKLFRLPGGNAGDYAEGMTVLGGGELAVVFDQPHDERLEEANSIRVDVFEI